MTNVFVHLELSILVLACLLAQKVIGAATEFVKFVNSLVKLAT